MDTLDCTVSNSNTAHAISSLDLDCIAMSVAAHHVEATTHHNDLHVSPRLSHKLSRSVHLTDVFLSPASFNLLPKRGLKLSATQKLHLQKLLVSWPICQCFNTGCPASDVATAHSHSTDGSLMTALNCISYQCEDRHMVHYMLLMHKNLQSLQQG